MAITADIALLSPAFRNAAPASPVAGLAFAAVLGQVASARGAQSKRDPGPVPNALAPDDHAEISAAAQSDVPQKTAAAAAAPSSTIQPIFAPRASPAFTPDFALGAVAAPPGLQPSRKDTLAATTGLATTAEPVAEHLALPLSPLSGPPSSTAIQSAPPPSATIATRQPTETTVLAGNPSAPQAHAMLAPRLVATVQTAPTARASATPSAGQAPPMPESQVAATIRSRAGSTTLRQGTVSGPPEPSADVSAPVMRIVSATATTARTSKITKPLNAAATPQAQALPVQPFAAVADAAILPPAVVPMGRSVAGATVTAIPLSPRQHVAAQTFPLASGTPQNDVTPEVAAAALPKPLAGPAARPAAVLPGNTAVASPPRLPALPVATRDPPSPTILAPVLALAVSPSDTPAARPIATPEPQPIGQQEPRQAATIVSTPAAKMAASASPPTPAAASIAAPLPAQTVRTLSAAASPADASTEAASAGFAAPAADGSAPPSVIASSQAAQPILEPPARLVPKSTGAAAPPSAMPESATAPLPPSTANQTIAVRSPPPSAVTTPPTATISVPAAKAAHVAATNPVSRIAPTRQSSGAATSIVASFPAGPPSDPAPAPAPGAPGQTPAGNSAPLTRDKTAAPPTQADASPSASPAPQAPLSTPAPQADLRDAGFAPRQPDKDTQAAATADASAIIGTSASTATTAPASSAPAAQPAAAATPPAAAQTPPPAAQLADAAANLHVGADGTSHVTIRLDPAELGHVQIRISRATDGTTSIDVAVERPDTLATLQNDLGHLHQALDRAGLPDQRSVTMHLAAQSDQGGSTSASANTGSGNGFTPQGGFQQGARQQHPGASQSPALAAAMPDSASIPLPPRPAAIAGSGVNITA